MTTNIGTIDRTARFVIGVALLALATGYIPGYVPQMWAWVGLIPLATAVFGICPAYTALGVSTCGRKTT